MNNDQPSRRAELASEWGTLEQAVPSLLGFPVCDLQAIVAGLNGYQKTVNVGAAMDTDFGDVHLESTTAFAARFITQVLQAKAAVESLAVAPALSDRISAYDLGHNVSLQRVPRKGKPDGWAVRCLGECLNHDMEWEPEMRPSERTDDFLTRCRFASAQEAYTAWLAAEAAISNKPT